MSVIAVINRKGGSGKSTLATHLAAYCSGTGAAVMIGDVDRQQSTQTWLRLRKSQASGSASEIVGWSIDPSSFARPPAGIDHVILDTPGGLRGFDLARVVMYADAILMPVCNSIFDRESATECLAELRTLPRVANGRCRVGAIGMRIDARTRGAEVMQAWASGLALPFVAVLRESQAYVRCIENGLSLFDLPAPQVEADLAQWKPILQWLHPVLQPEATPAPEAGRTTLMRAPPARPPVLRNTRPIVPQTTKPAAPPYPRAERPVVRPVRAAAVSPVSRWIDALPIPRFLQRTP